MLSDADYLKSLREDLRFQAELANRTFQYSTTWGLFSPRQIDQGSQLLIDYVDISENDHCLDLGCGYGVIGMAMAAMAPQGKTLMVDKDFVAIQYSQLNIQQNHLSNAKAMLSNGFDAIDQQQRFNVIASNIPAKVGKELLTLWLHDAYQHLEPGGTFYVVTINGLRKFMQRYMQEVFGNYDKLKQSTHYTIAAAIRT